MSRVVIPLDSAFVVELVAPVDTVNSNPLDFDNDEAAASFKAYDPGKDTVLVSSIAATAVLPIDPAGQMSVGDILEVTENSGAITQGTIISISIANNTVTTDTTVTAAAAGNRVRAVFGDSGAIQVAMTQYGTAKLGSLSYGFRGTLTWNHARMHKDNQNVDIEIRFIGSPLVGGPLNSLYVVCATVKRVCSE